MDDTDQRLIPNKFLKTIFSLFLLLLIIVPAQAQENKLPAFPGAGGFGKYTTGGRDGQVIFVTSLEDNTQAGTLRYAVIQNYLFCALLF